ncbi:MAG: DUF4388 domain-containing protein [Planctomycetota bacterium]|jgi:tetratricopeptide (TPR) repeat protein
MGFQGSLDSVNLGDVLQTLSMNHQTGTLVINGVDATRLVWFDRGEIALVDGTDSDGRPTLLNTLSHTGHLTPTQSQQLTTRLQEGSQSLRSLLINSGLLATSEIDHTAAACMEDRICEAFEFEAGTFDFIDGEAVDQLNSKDSLESGELRLKTQSVVMEAMRRRDEWAQIHDLLPDLDALFIVDNDGRKRLGEIDKDSDRDLLKVLRYLDGKHDVKTIAKRVGLSRFDAFAIVAQLVGNNIARARTPSEVADDALELRRLGDTETALTLLNHAATHLDHPEVLRPLAELRSQAGDIPGAVGIYLKLVLAAQDAGDYEQALSDLDILIEINPDDPDLHTDRAEVLVDLDRSDEAVGSFIDAANAFLAGRDIDRAVQAAHRAKDIDPASPVPHRVLARAHQANNQADNALVEYRSLWHALLSCNRPRKALDLLEEILSEDCKFPKISEEILEHARGNEAVKTQNAVRLLVYVLVAVILAGAAYGGWQLYERKIAQVARQAQVDDFEQQINSAGQDTDFVTIDTELRELARATADQDFSARIDELRQQAQGKRQQLADSLARTIAQNIDDRHLEQADADLAILNKLYAGVPTTPSSEQLNSRLTTEHNRAAGHRRARSRGHQRHHDPGTAPGTDRSARWLPTEPSLVRVPLPQRRGA